MNRTIKWKTNEGGQIVSLDGYITVYQLSGKWCMMDEIESDETYCDTRDEALDAGAMRMMIIEMGNFSAFLPTLSDRKDLDFTHQIY